MEYLRLGTTQPRDDNEIISHNFLPILVRPAISPDISTSGGTHVRSVDFKQNHSAAASASSLFRTR